MPPRWPRERPDVAIVGAPFDDAVSHRPGARFGPRAIRQASYHAGAINSLQLDIEPYDWLERRRRRRRPGHADGHRARPRRDRAQGRSTSRAPAPCRSSSAATTRSPFRRPRPWPGPSPRAGSASSTSTRTPMPRTRRGATCARTARRCAGSSSPGAVAGRNFVQVGLRGYWPGPETLDWMREQGMRWHLMTEIEERGSGGGHRRRHRRGARRAGGDLPVGRHRRHRSRAWRRAPARPSRAGC